MFPEKHEICHFEGGKTPSNLVNLKTMNISEKGKCFFNCLNDQTITLDKIAKAYKRFAQSLNYQEGYRRLCIPERIQMISDVRYINDLYKRADSEMAKWEDNQGSNISFIYLLKKTVNLVLEFFGFGPRAYLEKKAEAVFCMFTQQEIENLQMRVPEAQQPILYERYFKESEKTHWYNPWSPRKITMESLQALQEELRLIDERALTPGFLFPCHKSREFCVERFGSVAGELFYRGFVEYSSETGSESLLTD